MRIVWKYPLETLARTSISMPDGATILCLQMQGEIPTLWALVNPPGITKVTRRFRFHGTGHHNVDDGETYIGTVQWPNGLVFHLFEEP